MQTLEQIAQPFVDMAHQIVWASAATVDVEGRPRSRILHPIWQWDGKTLVGYIATGPTRTKRAHLEKSPFISLNYWASSQDTCVADCHASWAFDDETRTRVWALFRDTPAPVGYDPAMIPGWDKPTSPNFAVLCLKPWHLRVFPGSVLLGKGGEVLSWRE